MDSWTEFLYFLGVLFIGWLLYSYIKNRKDLFSSGNLIKSLNTLGVLAILLILFIFICIVGLKES